MIWSSGTWTTLIRFLKITGTLITVFWLARTIVFTMGVVGIVVIYSAMERRKEEGNILINDTLNTFYLRLYGFGHIVMDHWFLYMHHLTQQDSTYNGLCYTSRGALDGTRNSSKFQHPTTHRTMNYQGTISRSITAMVTTGHRRLFPQQTRSEM